MHRCETVRDFWCCDLSIINLNKDPHIRRNFSFLCSGQSGSGKTEATKLIVHYLSSMYQAINDNLRQVIYCSRHPLLNVLLLYIRIFFGWPLCLITSHQIFFFVFDSLPPPSTSQWRSFPSWRVLEMPRPSSTTTQAALASTSTSTFSSESTECHTLVEILLFRSLHVSSCSLILSVVLPDSGVVVGTSLSKYLLEKSRVVFQVSRLNKVCVRTPKT